MSQIGKCHCYWSAIIQLCRVSTIVGLASALSGCAVKMPSFGFGKSGTTTASIPKDKYAMNAPPAAYARPSRSALSNNYQAAPLRPQRPASPWVWSDGNRATKTITVRRGASLYGIASRRRVAISELMAANRLSGPNVTPGQQLLVPLQRGERRYDEPSSASAQSRQPYGVTPRGNYRQEQAPRVVSRFDQDRGSRLQPRLFERSSETLDGRPLEPAQTYSARRTASDERIDSGEYHVRSGDTLYAIARRARIAPGRLARYNKLNDPSRLRPGMVLNIPR